MIKSAKEAREIISSHSPLMNLCNCPDCEMALIYLSCLEGPEVKALVKALKKLDYCDGGQECWYQSCPYSAAEKALSKFYEATKKDYSVIGKKKEEKK